MENLFEIFLRQWSLPAIQQAFYQLCISRGADPTDYANVYEKLKQADRFCDSSFKQKQLWDLLDKRCQQKVYQNQTVCRGMNVLIVGAGPCGLRAAIECALLGCQVVVVDSRDKFTRNNILHLWKFVIEDLRGLGAKVFMPNFCVGSIEHISIKKLQFILLKVALVLGVQFYDKIEYKDLKEPQDGKTWRAIFEPYDHILNDFEFDVIIGASGKQKCLPAFKHNPVRGKLAIGITANFVRHKNKEEDSVSEIQGVAYVYRQDYFDDLERKTKIQLENIVYYKGDTHYFVMCGKKNNLISKGVIKNDKEDIKALLANDNVDKEMLCKYVTQVVDYVTEGKLSELEFALNARKKPDVAAFDFTQLDSADHSTRYVKYLDRSLILSLVGDYLHEPFWPTGSGCARGFLSVMDTAWLLRNVGLRTKPIAELLAEREGIYSLLSTTQPNNLSTAYHLYTIDPSKRYTSFKPSLPSVDHLMGTDNDEEDLSKLFMQICRQSGSNIEFLRRCSLFRFCFMAALSKKIRISNFRRSSWADGCALAALISKYNPDFTTSVPITSNNPAAILCSESFEYAEKHLGIPRPCQTQYEWAIMNEQDRIEYLEKLAGVLRANPYYATNCMSPTLLRNFNQNRALECAIQARIFRPKKYMEANDSVFDFNTLESTENVTVRSKKPKLDSIAIQNVRRSSIEPLNPELVFKIDKLSSNSYVRTGQSDQFRAASKLLNDNLSSRQAAKSETSKEPVNPPKTEDILPRESLIGVNTVSQFRRQFDNSSSRQRTPSIKSNTDSTTSSQLCQSDTSNTEDDHPTDPMHVTHAVGSLPSSGFSSRTTNHQSSASDEVPNNPNVVFRSTTQHQFVSSRRPISTPNMLTSPELCKTFGQKKTTKNGNTAQQQVYKTVSQRRMRLCALCNEEVYLAEQKIVDDRLCVHKQCFRCAFCNRILEVGKAFVDRSFVENFGVRWYCAQHTRKPPDEKFQQLTRMLSKKNSTVVAVVSPTKSIAQKTEPSSFTKPSYPQRTFIVSSSTESSTSSSLNELIETVQALNSNTTNHHHEIRPPTPPNKKFTRLSGSSKYRKRLSDLNSPTQLIEACKQRTNLRLVSLGLKDMSIDENTYLETLNNNNLDGQNTTIKNGNFSSSDQENDRQSSESFEEDQYYPVEDEEEYLDAEEEFPEGLEDQEAWNELKSYLENSLVDSQLLSQYSDPTRIQAQDLIETFNKRSLFNHFNGPQTLILPNQKVLEPDTPYFTPKQDNTVQDNQPDEIFYTPKQVCRRSSTLDRKNFQNPAIGYLKPQTVNYDAPRKQFESIGKNGIDMMTPQRLNRRRIPRGPRRATVAVDLKRESLAPDDAVATKNLDEHRQPSITTTTKVKRSPSTQQRRRAFHIRPTEENLERVIREIEMVKNRRKSERERHVQGIQRRMDEVEVRINQVCKVGTYLERSLLKKPRDKWELEQWLIYSQQYEELQNELEKLNLELKISQLEDQYQQLRLKLHAQQDATLTAEGQTENEKSEKAIMQLLLELLNEKDSLKALLCELQTETRPRTRTPPAELVKRAPSYTCYSAVFIEKDPRPMTTQSVRPNGGIPIR